MQAQSRACNDTAYSIAGYTIANDFGLHDFRDTDQDSMLRVKGSDTLGALGPGLVTGWDFRNKRVRTLVNGGVVQDGSTEEMIWDMHYLVADLARTITLMPGDVILSGTPANSRPVEPGDNVMVEVEGLGTLTNTIVAGKSAIPESFGAQPSDSDAPDGVGVARPGYGSNLTFCSEAARSGAVSPAATASLETADLAACREPDLAMEALHISVPPAAGIATLRVRGDGPYAASASRMDRGSIALTSKSTASTLFGAGLAVDPSTRAPRVAGKSPLQEEIVPAAGGQSLPEPEAAVATPRARYTPPETHLCARRTAEGPRRLIHPPAAPPAMA